MLCGFMIVRQTEKSPSTIVQVVIDSWNFYNFERKLIKLTAEVNKK